MPSKRRPSEEYLAPANTANTNTAPRIGQKINGNVASVPLASAPCFGSTIPNYITLPLDVCSRRISERRIFVDSSASIGGG
jgi:hypothetical protein